LPLPDFESGASAISPHRQPLILKYFLLLLQSLIFKVQKNYSRKKTE